MLSDIFQYNRNVYIERKCVSLFIHESNWPLAMLYFYHVLYTCVMLLYAATAGVLS